ncbi:MAG: hypothetical protein H7Y28_08965 [Rhodoferax sp.]|nr:hypothetical protein [Rhodoferax sp.]
MSTLNDGSSSPPALHLYINMGNVHTLPANSVGPKGSLQEKLLAIKAAGFVGIQGEEPPLCHSMGLGCAGSARFNTPCEVAPGVSALKAEGFECATLHVGWGHESDAEIDALVSEIIGVSIAENFPLYIETHRATITQDSWRTVQMVARHPGVRFNGDFSHWYTGLEMPYGDMIDKLNFMTPVFERVRFFHGRMGNSSHIQVPLADPTMSGAVEHFKEIWVRCLTGFLQTAVPGDFLVFAPELLHPEINYARTIINAQGERVEESDRWLEALQYAQIIQTCFATAQQRVTNNGANRP